MIITFTTTVLAAMPCFKPNLPSPHPLVNIVLPTMIPLNLCIMLTCYKVSVGRSELKRGRQRVDKTFGLVKINVHKEASYSRLLEKCRNAVWVDSSQEKKYSYSLMDSQGLTIDDKLIIDHPDGVDRELPWSLDTFVKVTRKTYTTQPKFIVLRIPVCGKCFVITKCLRLI